MSKKFAAAVVVSIGLFTGAQDAFAKYDREKDRYYKEAMSEAKSALSEYVAQCNGKPFVYWGRDPLGNMYFSEFSGAFEEVRLIGAYGITKSANLKGKIWAGKFVADLGGSARSISQDHLGQTKVGAWSNAGYPEFDLVLENGSWQISNGVSVRLEGSLGKAEQGFTCSDIPELEIIS